MRLLMPEDKHIARAMRKEGRTDKQIFDFFNETYDLNGMDESGLTHVLDVSLGDKEE